jgi:Tfp pilus assembly protein PilF
MTSPIRANVRRSWPRRLAILALALGAAAGSEARSGAGGRESSALEEALSFGEDALARGQGAEGLVFVEKALERDAKSIRAWTLRARCAEALGEKDLRVARIPAIES